MGSAPRASWPMRSIGRRRTSSLYSGRDVDDLVGLLRCENERRGNRQNVADVAKDHAVLVHALLHHAPDTAGRLEAPPRSLVRNELDTSEEPDAAHVSDNVVSLESLECTE